MENILNIKMSRQERKENRLLHDNRGKTGYANYSIVCALMKMSGVGIVALSGKFGGSVASHNRGGSYLRTWVKPVNPRTIKQTFQRVQLATLAAGFRALGATVIASWNASAINFPIKNRLGQTIHPSGLDLYVALNVNLISAGVAPITTPPVPQDVLDLMTLSLMLGAGEIKLAFTVTPSPATSDMLIYATPGLSAGVSFVSSEYRLIGVMPHTTAMPFDITTMYTIKFGAPIVGTQVFVSARPVNIVSGQQGIGLTAKGIIA
jgi:hypothetical protein